MIARSSVLAWCRVCVHPLAATCLLQLHASEKKATKALKDAERWNTAHTELQRRQAALVTAKDNAEKAAQAAKDDAAAAITDQQNMATRLRTAEERLSQAVEASGKAAGE